MPSKPGKLSRKNRVKAYNNCSIASVIKGLWDRAIADYNKAISINPRYADVYNNHAWIYFKWGRR